MNERMNLRKREKFSLQPRPESEHQESQKGQKVQQTPRKTHKASMSGKKAACGF